MNRIIVSLLILSVLCYESIAQKSFQKMVGTDSGDEVYNVLQTNDEGYIVAGITTPSHANRRVYLVKFDRWGNHQWEKELGEGGDATCKSIYPTTDGGYIMGGYYSFEGTYMALVKTDAKGNLQWANTYGKKSAASSGYSARQTVDGGYIICGSTTGKGEGDVYIVKTNASGDMVWEKTYGGDGSDVAFSIYQTTDSGYVVAGQTLSFGHADGDIYLLKISADGTEEWTKTFGGANTDKANCVRQTSDGGFIVTGDISNKTEDIFLIKTDAKGKKLWQKTFGGTDEDHGRSVEQTDDGGYVIGGFTRSFRNKINDRDFYLIKTDSTGNEQWHKTFGGTGDDYGYSCKQTIDGGYIFAGFSDTNRYLNDVMIVKTDANGN